MGKFRKLFRQLPDPRAANARHDLLEVLFIALAAVLCGAESCSDMADFGQSKEGLLRLFLRLEHGVPSHDTFSRVFRLLKPQAFEFAFRQFMAGFAKANGLKLTGVVAIDGKALRGAYERGGRANPLHLVNVFAVDARMALAQQKAPGRLSFVTLACPNTCRLRGCCTSPAVTGPSRTSSIGCLTSISPRIAIGRGRTMLPRTSPFCAGSPSTSCEPTPTPHPYGAKSNAPAGTMPSSWKPSAICDSPGLRWGGSAIAKRRPGWG